jgi:hypothetical protein
MAAPEAAMAALSALLGETLDPARSRDAARALEAAALQPGFAIALLQLAGSAATAPPTRMAAALCFKNHVRRHWVRRARTQAPPPPPRHARVPTRCRAHHPASPRLASPRPRLALASPSLRLGSSLSSLRANPLRRRTTRSRPR